MRIATSGIFMYRDRYFRQVDGVTMCSPLGPTMANFCLADLEAKLLRDSSDEPFAPSLYLHYVDDIFCVFRQNSSHQQFLDKLHCLHSNLKFTSEIGPSVLPYLDTTISLPTTEDGCFTSKVFRKRTYTGLILNCSVVYPQKWKFGLIQCLLHRAYTISSNWFTSSQEVDFLKGVFSQNGYPEDLFTSCLRRFVNNKCDRSIQNSKNKEDRVETIFFIPYIGLPSIIFSRKLKELFKKYYCIDIRIVFTSFKVKNYFSLKCSTPLPLLANVVYKFKCLRDANNIYIGKTIRHLATRVKEHGTSPSNSAVSNHLISCETCKLNFSCDSFSLIDSGRNDFEVTIKEALHIKFKKPTINKQLFSQGSSFVLNVF